jgi:hypothetical protein
VLDDMPTPRFNNDGNAALITDHLYYTLFSVKPARTDKDYQVFISRVTGRRISKTSG